jgi:hypothetical protein
VRERHRRVCRGVRVRPFSSAPIVDADHRHRRSDLRGGRGRRGVVVESNGQSAQSQAMYLPNPVLVITWQTTVASLIGCVLVVRRGDATSQ